MTDDQYQALLQRMTKLEQEVAQMRDVLERVQLKPLPEGFKNGPWIPCSNPLLATDLLGKP